MKKVIIIAILILILSSCRDKLYSLKGGTAITVEGDTIEFYGGTISYSFFGHRTINTIAIINNSTEN